MLEIIKSIKTIGLDLTLKNFKLKAKDYGHKIIIKYDQIESPMEFEEVRESRGIVLEKDTWKVMSFAFKKFFNSAEGHASKIDWATAHILEKLDGSLIHLYWDWISNKWCVGTTGTAEGEGEVNNTLGTTFESLFWDTVKKQNLDISNLVKGFTYIFELTTPYNIVVKPHGTSSATLLACRNLENLTEVQYSDLELIGNKLNVSVVKSYDLNKGDIGVLLRTFENMSWYDEGYVIVDKYFNRIKVKNPAYVNVHHLKGKLGNHHIMGVVKSNEIDEFIATFPDRKTEIVALKIKYDIFQSRLENIWELLQDNLPKNITASEKKKYAMKVFELSKKYDMQEFSGLFFGLKDGSVNSVKEFLFNYDDKRFYHRLNKFKI